MKAKNQSALSALLVVRDDFATIRKTINYLQKQTAAGQTELVIVGPQEVFSAEDESVFREFHGCRFVQLESFSSLAAAHVAGIQQASAPIVAFCEDHAFPDRCWAEALMKAHQQPRAAVGPGMRNGNPQTIVSWASFFMSFGPWAMPVEASSVTHLPWFNNSYKRDVLLSYGEELEAMLGAESVLHWDLTKKGHELYLEPAAQTDHLNVAQMIPWLRFQFHAGRKFASSRCRDWGWFRRVFYCVASPLIPVVRFYRTQSEVRHPGRCPDRLMSVLCVLMLGLLADGLGQAIGYVAGVGDATEKTAEFELNRSIYL